MKKTKKVKFMYFYAYWDGCIDIKNECIDFCRNNNISFEAVDCETENGVNLSCKYNIRNCPVAIILIDGREIKRCKGNYALDMLKSFVRKS